MLYFLGDSIFEHSLYMNLEDTLISKLNASDTEMVAEDNARIKDVYTQFDSIKHKIKSNDDILFLSVGGNDMIEEIMNNDGKKNNDEKLNEIIKQHKRLVNYIRTYNQTITLYVCTVYKPPFKSIYPFHTYIDRWNNMILQKYKQNVIMIHDLCFEKKHFIDMIEPSELCVELLYNKIKEITKYAL